MTPMTTPDRNDLHGDVSAEVPEADAVEQATPASPDTADPDDTANAADRPGESGEADPADAWEQALPVPGGDDDYDHDTPAGSDD